MGFLRKLLVGSLQHGSEGMQVTLLGGQLMLEVVGESHYQDNLHMVVEAFAEPDHYGYRGEDDSVRMPIHAVMVAETKNQYDSNAISLWIGGHQVGYLARDTAKEYRPGLIALQKQHGRPIALNGVVLGRPGLYGVFLKNDPEDFGLPGDVKGTIPRPPESQLRTGLGAAMGTDDEDDSYDLSWMDDLPASEAKRIPKLRKLLEEEPDPIDRHFMFTQLEEDLYTCRDLWASALDEYDQVAEQHHKEMVETIRTALFEKFGRVPLIETYRQSAIRHQKARDWKASLLWAERGLEVYGEDAARPEAVEDLKMRAERATSKLTSGG